MASNFKVSDDAIEAALDAYADRIGELLDGGTFEIRTGAPPTNTTDSDSGTKLAEFALGDPAFSGSSGGVNSLAAVSSVLGLAAGDAGHYRGKTAAGVVVMQGTAGESGDTPDLVLNEKTIAVSSPCSIVAFSFEAS